MAKRDLRHFLDVLRQNGELFTLAEAVDLRYELGEFLRQLDNEGAPAVLFERVNRHSMRVAGNLVGTRRRLALAFDLENEDELYAALSPERQLHPRRVKTGPVKEVVLKAPRHADLTSLPIPIYHGSDSNPYITCGVVTATGPLDGTRSMGLHRIEIKGPRRMGIHLSNPPIARFAREAEQARKPLGIAISLGVHPLILLASILFNPADDKTAVASSLMRSPIDLIPCETVAAEVPALAEIVIEGKVLPEAREKEGPFGEITGYYHTDESHVIDVTAITHRKDAIMQALHPTAREVAVLIGPTTEMAILRTARSSGFPIRQVAVRPSTNGAHAVLSIRKTHESEPKQLLHFVLAGIGSLKHAVVVDDDVDVESPDDVEWAVATRFRGDTGLVCMAGMRARSIDLVKDENGLITKVGVDATAPVNARGKFARIGAPGATQRAVAKKIARLKGVKPPTPGVERP